MTGEEALLALASPAANAVGGVLDDFCPGAWSAGEPAVVADGAAALGDAAGATAFVAEYGGGAAGTAALVLTPEGLQRLAGVLMGGPADEPVADAPLTELQSSAVEEAMARLVAAAASAVGEKLGLSSLAAGRVRALPAAGEDVGALGDGGRTTVCALEVCGQPGWFVQVLPETVVARLQEGGEAPAPAVAPSARAALTESLRTTTVRVSAEVGRTRLPVESLVGVPAGTVIELDREADDPIDVYVNGRRYAVGRLVLTDTAEWAVRVERVLRD